MTVVIGIATSTCILFGCDSAATNSSGELEVQRNPKFFKLIVKEHHGHHVYEMLLAFSGNFRLAQVLEAKFQAPAYEHGTDVRSYMIRYFMPKLTKTLESVKGDAASLMQDTELLIGFQGHIFTIDTDAQLLEAGVPFGAIGCGKEAALGALQSLHKLKKSKSVKFDDKQVVEFVLDVAENCHAFVRRPWHLDSVTIGPIA